MSISWHPRAYAEMIKQKQTLANEPTAEKTQQARKAEIAASPSLQRVHDHAFDILQNAPLPDETKVALWEHFHSSRRADDLVERLKGIPVPGDTAAMLVDAKRRSTDTVLDPILRAMKSMDRETLDLCEQHPNVLKHFSRD